MVANVAAIAAIELLAAAQGVDFRRPLQSSDRLRAAHRLVRDVVPFWDRDRMFAPDLAAMRTRVERGDFLPFIDVLPL